MRLDGRVALVTGASSGLGERFAQALAENGAAVVCAARRQDRIEAVAGRINGSGGQAIPIRLDVTDSDALCRALDQAERTFGLVDILVNNAGISGTGSVLRAERSGWDETLAVNLTAAFELGRFVSQRLAAAGKPGSIINISSVLGLQANADADYSVTKAGLVQLTRAMALDLA
ncbi:MAG: SDR family NAD(P)-dependent oxidoreductase, partial [Gammaproteobacteria bacterium]|nr:SDR family NAD(P)-dependent oxidoreductase [Gammaproteobacteria bacterium]